MKVIAKKHFGQHFLTDENIAFKIVNSLSGKGYDIILEVGPGMGVLTKYLLDNNKETFVSEIDKESIIYLKMYYPKLKDRILNNFLKLDIPEKFKAQVAIIGNFPYNISSQILFKIIDNYNYIPEMMGMFQKEVAKRIVAIPKTKDYGILSVILQAYYDVKYLFTVHENVFNPPPKVKSGVISMIRNLKNGIIGHEDLFKKIVKTGFNQRRKKLKNSLKILGIPEELSNNKLLNKRAEELTVDDFINIAQTWKKYK